MSTIIFFEISIILKIVLWPGYISILQFNVDTTAGLHIVSMSKLYFIWDSVKIVSDVCKKDKYMQVSLLKIQSYR